MRIASLLEVEQNDGSRALTTAVDAYIDSPRPVFTRLPVSYRKVPLWARTAVLRGLAMVRTAAPSDFPAWPIERRIDDKLRDPGVRLSYGGKSAAAVITHDIDSHGELAGIDRIRSVEASLGVVSSFGFVPAESWPSESFARSLVEQGCEVYWHDIAHNGRLPYLGKAAIRAEFVRVAEEHPWSTDLMHAFRAGQLLVSRDLLDVVAERFAVDMSIPDTERDGPFGGAAGCGTVIPFRYGPLLELPLTLPQEVYLHMVYGLSAEAVLQVWIKKLNHIRAVGGVAVFNIHPVWVTPRHPDLFRAFQSFVETLAHTPDLLITTPSGIASLAKLATN
jgi:hypothetical protein